MPANAFKTLFLLLTLLATCAQCLLSENKVSRYTPSNLGLRTSGISESANLILIIIIIIIINEAYTPRI